MRLYFLRHGETQWNVEHRAQGQVDIPLNEYGRYLARETQKGLNDINFDFCYSSPLERAMETARIILEGKDTPILKDERIKEVAFGDYEGIYVSGPKVDKKIAKEFLKFFTDASCYIPPNGAETIPELIARAQSFLDDIMSNEEYEDKTILVSSHGAILRALTGILEDNITIEKFFSEPVMPNCGVTVFDIKDGNAKLMIKDKVYYKDEVKTWILDEK